MARKQNSLLKFLAETVALNLFQWSLLLGDTKGNRSNQTPKHGTPHVPSCTIIVMKSPPISHDLQHE